MKIRDLEGMIFNHLTVIKRAGSTRQQKASWLCLCVCGVEKVFSSCHLTRKRSPVISCGCFKKSLKGPNHPQWNGCGEISGNWWYSHVLRERFSKRTNVPCTVSIEFAWGLFLKQNRKCSLSGIPLTIDNTAPYNTASVDRISSSEGYTEENIQWVHKDINFMKRTYTQEYFIDMCTKVYKEKK